MFEKFKLNKFKLRSHIIDDITNSAAHELKDWMSTHQYRTRVNKGAISNIFTAFTEAKPVRN